LVSDPCRRDEPSLSPSWTELGRNLFLPRVPFSGTPGSSERSDGCWLLGVSRVQSLELRGRALGTSGIYQPPKGPPMSSGTQRGWSVSLAVEEQRSS
jgi:hypothetical protein